MTPYDASKHPRDTSGTRTAGQFVTSQRSESSVQLSLGDLSPTVAKIVQDDLEGRYVDSAATMPDVSTRAGAVEAALADYMDLPWQVVPRPHPDQMFLRAATGNRFAASVWRNDDGQIVGRGHFPHGLDGGDLDEVARCNGGPRAKEALIRAFEAMERAAETDPVPSFETAAEAEPEASRVVERATRAGQRDEKLAGAADPAANDDTPVQKPSGRWSRLWGR